MNTLARQSRQAAVSLPQASDKDARVAYWCLIFLTFIMYVAPMGFFPVLIPLHLALVAAVISVLGYIAAVFAHGLRWSVWAPEVKLILWLAIFAIVSIPFSKWPGGSYEVFFDIYMKAIIVFFLIANLLVSERRIRGFVWALALFSAFNAIVGINNYRTGSFLAGSLLNRIQGGYSGLTSNPNDLALSLNLFVPLLWYLVRTGKSSGARLLALTTLAAAVICIVVTFSRGGAITLFAMLVCFALGKPGARRLGAMIGVIVVVVLIVILAPGGYDERLLSSTDFSMDKTGSAQQRWELTKWGLRQAIEHPFGTGLGMHGLLYVEEGGGWTGVHNVYLEISADIGVIPAILFIMLLWKMISSMRHVARSAPTPGLALLGECMWCSLIGFAVAAMFYPVAYNFYIYILAGIAVALRQVVNSLSSLSVNEWQTPKGWRRGQVLGLQGRLRPSRAMK